MLTFERQEKNCVWRVSEKRLRRKRTIKTTYLLYASGGHESFCRLCQIATHALSSVLALVDVVLVVQRRVETFEVVFGLTSVSRRRELFSGKTLETECFFRLHFSSSAIGLHLVRGRRRRRRLFAAEFGGAVFHRGVVLRGEEDADDGE